MGGGIRDGVGGYPLGLLKSPKGVAAACIATFPPTYPHSTTEAWVLLIEDEARLADTVRRGLEEEGFAVDVARDAREGEAKALANGYDAFVVDRRCPTATALASSRRSGRLGGRSPCSCSPRSAKSVTAWPGSTPAPTTTSRSRSRSRSSLPGSGRCSGGPR